MLDILLLESEPDIGERVKRTIAGTEYFIYATLDCNDRLAVLGGIAWKNPELIVLGAPFSSEMADLLREIRQVGCSAQMILVVDAHTRTVSRTALDFGVEWVLDFKEMELLPLVLGRVERRRNFLVQVQEEKRQQLFLELIKSEKKGSFNEIPQILREYASEAHLQIAIVRVLPPYKQRNMLGENNLVVLKSYEMLLARLKKLTKYLTVRDGIDVIICVMGDEEELQAAQSQFRHFLRDMLEFSRTIANVAAWVSQGNRVDKIQDLAVSYRTATIMLEERMLGRRFEIFEAGEHLQYQEDSGERFQVLDVRKTLVNALGTLDGVSCHKTLMQLK